MINHDYDGEISSNQMQVVDSIERLRRSLIYKAFTNYRIPRDIGDGLVQDAYLRVQRSMDGGKIIHYRGLPRFIQTVFTNLCRDWRKSKKNTFKNMPLKDGHFSSNNPLDILINEEEIDLYTRDA